MNKSFLLFLTFCIFIFDIKNTSAYYTTSDSLTNKFNTNTYKIKLHTDEGYYNNTDILIKNNTITLPTPEREGYSFKNYYDLNNTYYENEIFNLNSLNNKDLYALWDKNYYNVNYYLDDELLFTKVVGYDDNVENININYLLDKYHSFISWSNYQSNMPAKDINLYANIGENYCKLITGHGPSGNAITLKRLFESIGYNTTMRRADDGSNQYLVETDYNLTLKEFEDIVEYLETNTNYTSYYPYPYLYWLGLNCSNGYSKVLQRNVGSIHFE